MAPALLTVVEMQRFQSLLNSLMAGETRPLVVTCIRTELGLGQIRLGLMQPVSCSIHRVILRYLISSSGLPPLPQINDERGEDRRRIKMFRRCMA